MSRNLILNLSEENYCTEAIVGQSNDPTQAVSQIHPTYGTMFTKSVALPPLMLVGQHTDGKFYLASAAAGSFTKDGSAAGVNTGQLRAVGINFQEATNGMAIDVITESRTIKLATAVAGANPGDIAYLSTTVPGGITNVKPSTTGQLVQIVGRFCNDNQTVKIAVSHIATVN